MYSLSTWAHRHKALARLLLAIAWILLLATAWVGGNWLAAAGFEGSEGLLSGTAITASLFLLVYPLGRAAYRVRKRFDGALVACTFLLLTLLSAGAESGPLPLPATAARAASVSEATQAPPKGRKALRRLARRLRAHYRASGDGGKTTLILLTVLVALLLGALVLALSCSIACSGFAVLAIIVGVLGGAGIVIGAIAIIRRIVNGPKKKPETMSEPAGG